MPTAAGRQDAGGEDRVRTFERIMDAAGARLYRVARGILADHHAAQDAVQEALCRFWSSPPAAHDSAAVYAWLRRVTVNECLNRLRKKSETVVEDTRAVDARYDGPATAAAGVEAYKQILGVMAELPEAQRAVLSLRVFEQLGYQPIADLLGCGVGTVMSRLHRARQTLIGRLTTLGLLPAGDKPERTLRLRQSG